ncbi:alpha/beta hydrolase [Wenzhouxiangella sediminis]|nr:alpha/beta hydrolase-fold protein [Wenzhouxiangella sediminis]
MNRTVCTVALISLAFCCLALAGPSTDGESTPLARLFGMGPAENFTIRSETLERDFHVYIRLPREYAESECDWPVVYMLDGGILFPMLAPLHLMMEIDDLAPPAVLVGISYGGLGYANGNMRSTDYTAPAPEPDYYGGADAYQRFLSEELIPKINRDYRVDHDRSLVLGQSLGGQFTLYTALTRPDLFGAYLSINPALHRNVEFFIELEPAARQDPTPLLITRASEDREPFRNALDQWLEHWRGREAGSLALSVQGLEDEHHASSAPAAYRQAMAWWAAAGGDTCSGSLGSD